MEDDVNPFYQPPYRINGTKISGDIFNTISTYALELRARDIFVKDADILAVFNKILDQMPPQKARSTEHEMSHHKYLSRGIEVLNMFEGLMH